jgi:MFS family permease
MKGKEGQGGTIMSMYTIITLALCFLSVLLSAHFSKRTGTLMEYMAFIMSFSMSIGLSIGFYLGIVLKGELLYSTLLATLISGLIGFLIGIRFHLYTALEGLFSGLMAGMMGAMVTEMLNNQQAHAILLISLLLTIAITTSCIIQFLSETFSPHINQRFLVFLSIGIIILLTVFATFPEHSPTLHQQEQPIHQH